VKKVLSALALLPAVWLAIGAWRDALGANPIEEITHTTGLWGLRLLLASLAITPLRRLTGWNRLIAYRRTLGLLAFTYAVLHVATYVVLDHWFDWARILADIRKRPYVTAGAVAFACLVPLAITSTRGWIRRLGKRWTALHRLAYVAAAAAVVHYWWLVKADVRAPFWYGAVLAILLLARTVPGTRRRLATSSRRAA
jgi:sulfoxide reductase heme-binding subunit YedZ